MEGDADRWHDPARSNELSDQMAAIHLLPTPHGMAKEGRLAGRVRPGGLDGHGDGRRRPRESDERAAGAAVKLLPTEGEMRAEPDANAVNDAGGDSTAPAAKRT
jgi:hypothetical protein